MHHATKLEEARVEYNLCDNVYIILQCIIHIEIGIEIARASRNTNVHIMAIDRLFIEKNKVPLNSVASYFFAGSAPQKPARKLILSALSLRTSRGSASALHDGDAWAMTLVLGRRNCLHVATYIYIYAYYYN